MTFKALKILLDGLYQRYKKKYSSKDPVWILHKFEDPNDIEIIGLITSCYAYGQVELIKRFIVKILDRIGNNPYEFTINFSKRKDKKFLEGLGYRFHKDHDLINLFLSIHNVLKKYGSLQNLFIMHYCDTDDNIIPALSKFSSKLTNQNTLVTKLSTRRLADQLRNGKDLTSKSYFSYLIPNPFHGSTCKRLMLYLRWMIRKDEIDFGIWNKVPASKLIMPVDTHISRVAKKLKLVKRESIDLKFAIELTKKLKHFDYNDPVKYDFSLCHYEMEFGLKNSNL